MVLIRLSTFKLIMISKQLFEKVARVAQSTSFTSHPLNKYAIKMKNGNNKRSGKLLDLAFGVEK